MSIYSALVRRFLAPAFDVARGTGTMSRLGHLERSQWWPRDRIEVQQATHLRALVQHAYGHVPYYRRMFDERGLSPDSIQTPEDLRLLSVLSKDDIREHAAELISDAVPRDQLRAGWSGGTTGERLTFFSTRQERLTYAYARWALTLEWTGVNLGEAHVSIRQQRTSGVEITPPPRLSHRLQRLTRVDVMSVREENLAAIARLLQQIRPRTVHSYPSTLVLIAAFMKNGGLSCPRIPSVCVAGERLSERQERILTEVFGSIPFIRYGSNELHEVAGQCEVKDGLHVLAEDFIIEVVDSEARPVPPGTPGHLLITSLHNYGQPFIRYAPGDIGTLRSDVCPCGRGLPLMSPLVWRTREYLRSASGERVAATDIPLEPLLPDGAVQYQLVQESLDRFLLRVVPAAPGQSADCLHLQRRVSDLLNTYLRGSAQVEVRYMNEIEMNLSGKRLSFVSNLEDLRRPFVTKRGEAL